MKVAAACPMAVRGTVYELERNAAGVVEYISATVVVNDESQWPQITQNPTPGVALGINMSSPAFPFIGMELRVVEGLLSLWGIESIDIDNAEEFWLPDNDVEKERLKLFSLKRSFKALTDEELHPISFDLIARSFVAALVAKDIEIPLSFFRKGRIDSRERRYIEAIYDYYFVLETVYSDGKTKNNQVKHALQQNAELCRLVQATIADEFLLVTLASEAKLQQAFQKNYQSRSAEEILGHFVELRGFLHHHTSRRPGIWHPEEHSRFELDALVLERVAFSVVFKLIEPHIFSDKTVRAYHSLLQAAGYETTEKVQDAT
jgi:hypothetical protein